MFLRLIKLSKAHSFFLLGPRGVGKSTLLKQKFSSDQCLWLDLLDSDVEDRLVRHPNELYTIVKALPEQTTHVVIDEIQKIPKLLNEVHRLIEETKKYSF